MVAPAFDADVLIDQDGQAVGPHVIADDARADGGVVIAEDAIAEGQWSSRGVRRSGRRRRRRRGWRAGRGDEVSGDEDHVGVERV